MKLSHRVSNKISPTLKSWFPILKSSILDLEQTIREHEEDNPFMEIKSHVMESTSFETKSRSKFDKFDSKRLNNKSSNQEMIERLSVYEKSLRECLMDQIVPPLFPTSISQEVAEEIIDNLDEDGYFIGNEEDIAKKYQRSIKEINDIRSRFRFLDPPGIASKNLVECMNFQLEHFDLDDDMYELCSKIIQDLNHHMKFINDLNYIKAMQIIKSMRGIPSLDFTPKEIAIVPDIIIKELEGALEVSLNSKYYPEIIIASHECTKSKKIPPKKIGGKLRENLEENTQSEELSSYQKVKIKEARDLIDALDMRKSTIKKIGLMILEYQYSFFKGGDIKPMKLQDIAKDLGYAASTISRAIANKYLECDKGIYPISSFFTTAISEDISNASIKNFIKDQVDKEDKLSPLSDAIILNLIQDKFNVKMVRRTITKYRKQLDIPSSSERKSMYGLRYGIGGAVGN